MVSTSIPYARSSWDDDYAWNIIIGHINELATNPPDGCDPVDTLDEVDEDHIWSKEDITDVHATLLEICDENVFTELLENQLWTSTIIDEINTAIEKGWCQECEEEQDEWTIGTWQMANESGSFAPTCGGYTNVGEPNIPGGCFLTIVWNSPCISEVSTSPVILETAQGFYDIAYEESRLWVDDRRDELLAQREVEDLTAELLPKRAELETLRGQLAACSSGCGAISARIAELEAEISELENDIQIAKDERDVAKDAAEIHLDLADTAALANWVILKTYESFYTDINIVTESLQNINKEWGMGNYPYSIPQHSNFVAEGRWPNGNRVWALFGFFTPTGYPYSDGNPGMSLKNYYTESTRIFACPASGGYTESDWIYQGCSGFRLAEDYEFCPENPVTFTHSQHSGSTPVDEYEPNPDQ